MVDVDAPQLNPRNAEPENLSAVFEALADWEHQIAQLAPEDRAFIESGMEEPTP